MTKICDVCGDKGRARNFEAMTCESCKIFFRRHGLKNQQLICASNGKCDINVMTRSLCRKCRLEKCFAVGMKKELIRSVDQNNYRKALIKENKSKHKPRDESHNCDDFSPNNSQNNSIISDTTIDENFTTDSLDNNLLDFDDIDWDVNVIENNPHEKTNVILVNENKRQELSVIPVFKTISDYNGINQLESIRISELMSASNIFNYPLNSNAFIQRFNNLNEMISGTKNKSEEFIRHIIIYAKSLNGFNNICAEDRHMLMKYVIKDQLLIRCLKYYNKNIKSFIIPIDHDHSIQYSLDLYKLLDFKTMMEIYYEKFLSIWNYNDPIIIELLTAIILFNPNQPNLLHRNSIRLEQQLYIYLLQRYLLLKYRSESDSQTKVQQIMNSLNDINAVKEIESKYLQLKLYSKYLGPLQAEIFSP